MDLSALISTFLHSGTKHLGSKKGYRHKEPEPRTTIIAPGQKCIPPSAKVFPPLEPIAPMSRERRIASYGRPALGLDLTGPQRVRLRKKENRRLRVHNS